MMVHRNLALVIYIDYLLLNYSTFFNDKANNGGLILGTM